MPSDPGTPSAHDRGGHRVPRRASRPRGRHDSPPRPGHGRGPGTDASERFRSLDRYRAEREWKRYEGTPQRDLFRELRARFLLRHRPEGGWALDVGSGPGRFASALGGRPGQRILLDLSREMLLLAQERSLGHGPTPALVRGDGLRPPLRAGRFAQVVALGNPVGFAADASDRFLSGLMGMVAPGGTLLLEVVCGPGERSRYLSRLPGGAVRRLLAAPVNLVRSRAEREGFLREPSVRRSGSSFRRYAPSELEALLRTGGFRTHETLSVAPALGADADRLAAVRADPLAWSHLLELEEALGRTPGRYPGAAALLIAAVREA